MAATQHPRLREEEGGGGVFSEAPPESTAVGQRCDPAAAAHACADGLVLAYWCSLEPFPGSRSSHGEGDVCFFVWGPLEAEVPFAGMRVMATQLGAG